MLAVLAASKQSEHESSVERIDELIYFKMWVLGKRCEFSDPCFHSNCLNGATCNATWSPLKQSPEGTPEIAIPSYECLCPVGFAGKYCDLVSCITAVLSYLVINGHNKRKPVTAYSELSEFTVTRFCKTNSKIKLMQVGFVMCSQIGRAGSNVRCMLITHPLLPG